MSFLHKLWDETLAGPTPDSGLGKLRKYHSLSPRSAAAAPPPTESTPPIPIPSVDAVRSDARRNLSVSLDSASVPSSPSGPTTPTSPFTPNTPGGNFKRLARRKSTSGALPSSEIKSPTGYDWIVLSSLDR